MRSDVILAQDPPPELAEQHVVRRGVLRVIFEAHALEILDGVCLAVFQRLATLGVSG